MASVACHQHPDTPATGRCIECDRGVCEACTTSRGVYQYCPRCVARAKRKRAMGVAVLLAVVVGGGAFAAYRVQTYEAPFDYGRSAAEVKRLRALLEREPCDRKKVVELARLLNQAGDYRGTLRMASSFEAGCGPHPRLWWNTHYAHMQLSEFAEAERVGDALIERDPDDADFWYWRGLARKEQGKLAEAEADFRACTDPKSVKCPFELSDVLEKQQRPCEALFPIDYYVHHHPDQRTHPDVVRRRRRLGDAGCDRVGTGDAVTLPFAPGSNEVRAEVRLNLRAPRPFLVDTGASFVTIAKKDAAAFGIDPDQGRPIRLRSAGADMTGTLVLADFVGVQNLVAKNVEVAVLDGFVATDTAGLLGLSYLSRFEIKLDVQKGEMTLTVRDE